jgi:acetolactate synthase small subunit
MQKLEGVVIRMQQNFNNITFLFSNNQKLENIQNVSSEEIFSDNAIFLLNNLSIELYKSPNIREYPDVATFAFFCRKANIINLKRNYNQVGFRLGRGVVFHIAPSNVPVNFAYSMVAGLLSGNNNVVRVPSKNFEQVTLIIQALKNVVKVNHLTELENRLFLVKYEKSSDATEYFSSICDVRVIWGGDQTIDLVRINKIKPRSIDITFSDRYSFAMINAEKVLIETDIDKVTNNFFNDTYLFDQNACSAPRIVVWVGSEHIIDQAKNIFWKSVQNRIENYDLSPIIAVDKLVSLLQQSTTDHKLTKVKSINNKLWRISTPTLHKELENYTCAGGYFLEYNARSVEEISLFVTRKFQTMAYFGFEKDDLREALKKMKLLGIDRVVPFGKTTDFDLIWDGYDLIYTLSRECVVI